MRTASEKIRREFSANVSHELKTPLQSVLGYSEIMLSGLVKPEDTKRFLQKINDEAHNLLRLIDDPDVRDPIKFLREREIVHFQRFGEALSLVQQRLDFNNFYAFNPEFDKKCK